MRELREWAAFEDDFGPLTIHERIDAAIARISYAVHAAAGGQMDPSAFVVKWRRPVRWDDATIWKWLEAEAN